MTRSTTDWVVKSSRKRMTKASPHSIARLENEKGARGVWRSTSAANKAYKPKHPKKTNRGFFGMCSSVSRKAALRWRTTTVFVAVKNTLA